MVFHKIDEKVVFSCLLQYKPVCVINFDKLRRKMLKRTTSVVCLVSSYSYSSETIVMRDVISGCTCVVCILLRFDKKLFYQCMF